MENRHKGISIHRLNRPIALHVPHREYSKAERHRLYRIPAVQQCLSLDDQTKDIYDDMDALDSFFSASTGSIIGIIRISRTIKAEDHKDLKYYPFANIPKPAVYHWIIAEHIELPSPIQNYSGGLGVVEMKDNAVRDQIDVFLSGNNQDGDGALIQQQNGEDNQLTVFVQDEQQNVIRFVYDSEDGNDFKKICSSKRADGSGHNLKTHKAGRQSNGNGIESPSDSLMNSIVRCSKYW